MIEIIEKLDTDLYKYCKEVVYPKIAKNNKHSDIVFEMIMQHCDLEEALEIKYDKE